MLNIKLKFIVNILLVILGFNRATREINFVDGYNAETTRYGILIFSVHSCLTCRRKFKRFLFLKFFLKDISPFYGVADSHYGHLVTSLVRMDSLACMLCHLCTTDSLDSPLVLHLLTFSGQHGSRTFSIHTLAYFNLFLIMSIKKENK